MKMELIDKAAIIAEIQRRISVLEDNSLGIFGILASNVLGKEYNDILAFLDTLEVKEVDLEKELKTLDDTLFDIDGVAVKGATSYLTVEDVKDIAKYFFKLGLNSKGK